MIKILFFAANPRDTDPLQLGKEVRAIQKKLRASEHRDSFRIEQEWAVRVSDIQGHLLRHRPHIVHFSGHGNVAGEIILENQEGYSKPVTPVALKKLFATLKDNVRCVVLNTCFSKAQAEAITESIECVVGMSTSIGDEASISFAASFYQAIGFGRSIQTAFELACLEIELQNLGQENIPRLVTSQTTDPQKLYILTTEVNTDKTFPNIQNKTSVFEIEDKTVYCTVNLRLRRLGKNYNIKAPKNCTIRDFLLIAVNELGLGKPVFLPESSYNLKISWHLYQGDNKLNDKLPIGDISANQSVDLVCEIHNDLVLYECPPPQFLKETREKIIEAQWAPIEAEAIISVFENDAGESESSCCIADLIHRAANQRLEIQKLYDEIVELEKHNRYSPFPID